MTEGTSDGRSLELYVRSLTPADGPATDHARRVRDLAGSGRISEASVSVWGSEVGLATTAFRTPAGKWILDRVATFRSWADERELTMVPFFESRTGRSSVTGESYTALRLPVTCLAEYEDGELVHVAPHYDGTVACTVGDRLRRLEDAGGTDRGSEGGRGKRPVTH